VLGKLGKIKITFWEMREREKNCLLAYENVVVHIHSDETGKLFKKKKLKKEKKKLNKRERFLYKMLLFYNSIN
jgi:hypothetical protein